MDKEKIAEIIRQAAEDSVVVEFDKIPEIDLYMDQLTTFTEERLRPYKRKDGDKILTKTMINNYSKDKLIGPSVKKKYSRTHIAQILMVYQLKNSLAINDIGVLFDFLRKKEFCFERLYRAFVEVQRLESGRLESGIDEKLKSLETMEDRNVDLAYLAVVSLIIDANAKKRAAEKILDILEKEESK